MATLAMAFLRRVLIRRRFCNPGPSCAQIHHGSLVDVATALRDIIVAEHVLPANTIDLETLNARLQAEARSARANAAYATRMHA